jgi:hypothetical protein
MIIACCTQYNTRDLLDDRVDIGIVDFLGLEVIWNLSPKIASTRAGLVHGSQVSLLNQFLDAWIRGIKLQLIFRE